MIVPPTPARRGVVGELLGGAGLVWRGFGFWRRRPGVMALGMLPGLIVLIVVGGLITLLAVNTGTVGTWLTPFAEEWGEAARTAAREIAGFLVVLAAAVLAFYTFTTLTLIVGDPFYERIQRRVEVDLGGLDEAPVGFWRSVGGSILLVLRGALYAVLTFATGLIPGVGAILAPVLGAVLAGHLIGRELATRPFESRGIVGDARRALRRGNRARQLGFGVMTQLFFLVPGGAILVMPAAVVGSTLLVRQMLERRGLEATAGLPGAESPTPLGEPGSSEPLSPTAPPTAGPSAPPPPSG